MAAAHRAVVGAGAWGTTLALMLARGGPVTLLARDAGQARQMVEKRHNERYLPGVMLPVEIEVSTDRALVAAASELVVLAVPTAAMRAVARDLADHVPWEAVILSVAKGIERGTLSRMTEVVADEMPAAAGRVAALSGPNLALEIARGLPASSVVGAEDETVSGRVVEILGSRSFRLYRNRDVGRRGVVRRAEEHPGHRCRGGRPAGLRRQRQGRSDHARSG